MYGDSVMFFDPYDVEDIAKKINQVLIDPDLRADLIEKGYSRTKIYNWTHTAEKTLEVFNQAL